MRVACALLFEACADEEESLAGELFRVGFQVFLRDNFVRSIAVRKVDEEDLLTKVTKLFMGSSSNGTPVVLKWRGPSMCVQK